MLKRIVAGVFLLAVMLISLGSQAVEQDVVATAEPAELKVANRSIMVFHATLLGEAPAARARRAEAVINERLDEGDAGTVSVDAIQDSYLVLLGDRRAFIVSPKDMVGSDLNVRQGAEAAAQRLRQVVDEAQQARSPRFLLMAAGLSAAATLVYILLVKLCVWLHHKALSWLPQRVRKHASALRIGHTQLVDSSNLYPLLRRLLALLRWTLVLLLTYEWLSFVLQRFPYTRPWGESLNLYLLGLLRHVLTGIVDAIPGLLIALLIFFIARGISAFSKRLLERLARPGSISWLTQETLQPTTRLTSLAIWLFALAMAYPYLPGADTEAFKGLSVLIGLMISLGATSVVGQAAAGLILTYTRTLRPGEYVRIGEHEGTVTELGMFTTTIRTGLGEVLTLPNSMITGAVTKNYSRVVQGQGYVVDTTVTIGYDTPWRQVEAMLLEAARRTDGVLDTPRPQVFQTALSDFYPEYRLVAQAVPSEPRPRAELLTLLHANIQDVFNEYGVQIMSPHYLGDPAQDKVVPKEQWYSAPAAEPRDTQR
ncbi:mechanosensitive ion channel family protein [Pseudomonas sichuanensis]|uniref:mechanosensitive ion channel family protein n=1 Tax=Pseudomonas sichuanensis TaxID=2213015 RepID=UPI00244A89DF|nr:mechanosensitive ion channel domain-containing protein [Pseudomonas sichuanensis]MDH0734102.1 mechanosensitive ion channel family protein [Pseudomonas sichuanensis]MDH1585567.1 mechanosensitive ion channel family protein [Pseudomonas sichuanensis]MDH1594950.1 mechanosensitive ion channel family protein [Pseudomonas sichuanensis]MDH1600260.1 mechanosensitive ion channel family protein [Pseudomonas sichuanensis]